MTEQEFCRFFAALHGGRRPFAWQRRLAAQVLAGQWPAALALPTAAGKTAVIDIAVFALAAQAGLPLFQRSAPLRIFYAIDRRLVVDEVTAHAFSLSAALEQALTGSDPDPVVAEVARRLASFGGGRPLHVSAMRGGMYRDDSWTLAPNQPTVCVTTVDQVGSRLLFRGYGLSPFRWPVHAGLVASDALLVLDEAHLSAPFRETVEAVARYQGWAERPVTPPLRVLPMSATLADTSGAFTLAEVDLDQDPELAMRLRASKQAILLEPQDFEAAAVQEAGRLAAEPGVTVVGVVVNRVASARAIFTQLRTAGEAILLTGRIRPYDRERLLEEYGGRIAAERRRDEEQTVRPLYLVATQCVEVGANLDFDALVTEAAPLGALRQRFGRLDRLGTRQHSQAAVLLRRTPRGSPDPVYGQELADTWAWLKGHAGRTAGGVPVVDFGVMAMQQLLDQHPAPQVEPPAAPALLPAYVDLWAQTSPEPVPTPDVAPFLHGPGAGAGADVQVIWRADLDENNQKHWAAIVSMAPPTVAEALPAPVWAVRAWLGRKRQQAGGVADIEGLPVEVEADRPDSLPFLRWRGPADQEDDGRTQVLTDPSQIAPGDAIVVPAHYGGADRFGWHPDSTAAVEDIADRCVARQLLSAPPGRWGRRRLRLRVHAGLFPSIISDTPAGEGHAETSAALQQLLAALSSPGEQDQASVHETLAQLLQSLRGRALPDLAEPTLWDVLQRSGRCRPYPAPAEGVIIWAPYNPARPPGAPPPPIPETGPDESNEDDTDSMTRPVSLQAHQSGVAARAGAFARGCGLAPELVADIELAAAAHDLGKADERFQLMLYAGNRLAAAGGDLLAKSGMAPDDRAARHRAWRLAKLPPGFRHELGSVALLQAQPEALAGACDPDLVLHLVGTHHGRGRPFPPVVDDQAEVLLAATWHGRPLQARSTHGLERLESGWSDRFWRLVRKYGPWGLAYLEAILVLADGARSREEEQGA